MYINLEVYKNSGLLPEDIFILSMIKQIESEYIIENLTEEKYKRYEALNLIQHIKQGKKGEHPYKSLRLNKRCTELFSNLETPDVDEDSLKIFEWLKNIYTGLDKELGNQKKCKMYIAQFSAESGINRNCLAFLIQNFLNDDKEMEYSQRLEYLFYKGSSVFSVKFDLYQSRLYQYYQKQQVFFDEKFLKLQTD